MGLEHENYSFSHKKIVNFRDENKRSGFSEMIQEIKVYQDNSKY